MTYLMTSPTPLAAEEDIGDQIGHHITATIGGLTFNVDTIWSTVFAAGVVIGLGLLLRRRITSGVPSRLQLVFENVVEQVREQVHAQIGPTAPFVVPLAIALFMFILIANWLEIVPTDHRLPPPSADVNLTFALALVVIVWMHIVSFRRKGAKGYFKHFAQPYPVLVPINIIEEIAKPITLALRLFGNIFSGSIMIILIGLFPALLVPWPNAAWKLFDMFIGVIQAFIFALLTILYFAGAVETEESH
ncbi:MAG TPA: F0F1 ATP synthase subunit A [Streptosporangiaceae bacterium]|jgi:F-type H+-transporting ATPase subunit a|nr:F0F1 ATP synthase subunit A [Streptosporangiaceae bacterium]